MRARLLLTGSPPRVGLAGWLLSGLLGFRLTGWLGLLGFRLDFSSPRSGLASGLRLSGLDFGFWLSLTRILAGFGFDFGLYLI